MPTYRKQDLAGQGHIAPAPDPEPLSGLQVMRRPPAVAVMRGQDRCAVLGRRIVCDWGVRGDVVELQAHGSPVVLQPGDTVVVP